MSKRETDRAMLRAFGDAARQIQEQARQGRVGAWAIAQRLRRQHEHAIMRSRRQLCYLRALALAADTAFGG